MKGISSVIAVILILMITVALSAMAYVWFTEVFQTISGSAGNATNAAANQIGSGFSIISAYYVGPTGTDSSTVQIANTGTTSLKKENFIMVVASKTAKRTDVLAGDLAPGQSASFTIDNKTTGYFTGVICRQQIEVVYGSLQQTAVVAC